MVPPVSMGEQVVDKEQTRAVHFAGGPLEVVGRNSFDLRPAGFRCMVESIYEPGRHAATYPCQQLLECRR
jgi:hypothetical protein